MANGFDVFISYSHADQEWVRVLAENLTRLGHNVFFDEWEISPGDVLVHRLDQGLRASKNGVLVVSPSAIERPWVQAEYASMITLAVDKQLRVVPVLLQDAEIPPLLASRVYIDFRGAVGPVYETRIRALSAALKGERPARPQSESLKVPPGAGFTPQGQLQRTLRVTSEAVSWVTDSNEISASTKEMDSKLGELTSEVKRSLNSLAPRDKAIERQRLYAEIGAKLRDAFLIEPVAGALAEDIAVAERLGSTLNIGMEVGDRLLELPWEAIQLPKDHATPLALHPRVDMYRRVASGGPSPGLSIPGPLRVLVVIGSPEIQNVRGELLDMEAELRRILDAVEPARRRGHAVVRILEFGTINAIRAALEQMRYHVLYVSCHSAPGQLILEDDNGREHRVTSTEFWSKGLAPGRGVPLIVLSSCSTGSDTGTTANGGATFLPSVARELVSHGVPQVIAMQGPVGDRYATALAGRLFEALATWQDPMPLRAFAEARRALERERNETPPNQTAEPPEWPTPILYAARVPLPLYDTDAAFETIPPVAEPSFDKGVVVRRVGEMIGRRHEQRILLRALKDGDRPGVLIHGMGGVGKSTLVAQLLHRLGQEGWLVASVYGGVDVNRVLVEIGGRLMDLCLDSGLPEHDPLWRVANYLRDSKREASDRADLLFRKVLNEHYILLLFDNFESNLTDDRRPSGPLADFIARWFESPGRSRLIFTCRYPFYLPQHMEEMAFSLHLGPLSLAEARKLIWRLPGIDTLSPLEKQRAYEMVGGHPRALEILDALLRGGKARFPDVERKLKALLRERSIDFSQWTRNTEGNLGAALAETVTIAASDILLDELLASLAQQSLPRTLLLGASVYAIPVEKTALAYQVAEQESIDGSAAPQPPQGFEQAMATLEALTLLTPVRWTDDARPLWYVHRWTAEALSTRASAQELSRAHRAAAKYWVRCAEEHASDQYNMYGAWAAKIPEEVHFDATNGHAICLLNARHHYLAGLCFCDAAEVTYRACSALARPFRLTAEKWKYDLLKEVLVLLDKKSRWRPIILANIGYASFCASIMGPIGKMIEETEHWLLQCSTSLEITNDQLRKADSNYNLAELARLQGKFDVSLDHSKKALNALSSLSNDFRHVDRQYWAASEVLGAGDRYFELAYVSEACVNHDFRRVNRQLAAVHWALGELQEAVSYYKNVLQLCEADEVNTELASCYVDLAYVSEACGNHEDVQQFGEKALSMLEAAVRGEYQPTVQRCSQFLRLHEGSISITVGLSGDDRSDKISFYKLLGYSARSLNKHQRAYELFQKAVVLSEELGDNRNTAEQYRSLAMQAFLLGANVEARDLALKALELEKGFGDQSSLAELFHFLGTVVMLGTVMEDDQALDWERQALEIYEAIGDRKGMSRALGNLQQIASLRGNYNQAVEWGEKRLSLAEELDDKADFAFSCFRMGIDQIELGNVDTAVQYYLASFSFYRELESPDFHLPVDQLARLRQSIGSEEFDAIVKNHVGESIPSWFIELLDESSRNQEH